MVDTVVSQAVSSKPKKRILFVDDNVDLQRAFSTYFQDSYEVVSALDLKQAKEVLDRALFDLILLDLGLPDGSAMNLCHDIRVRSRTQKVPVIFLSARGEVAIKIQAFRTGADDYLVKPVDCEELEVRFETYIQKYNDRNNTIEFSDLLLQSITQFVKVKTSKNLQKEVPLTRTEFKILLTFVTDSTEIFTLSRLRQVIWSDSRTIASKTIEVHISNLNKKLHHAGSAVSIRFSDGLGYRIS